MRRAAVLLLAALPAGARAAPVFLSSTSAHFTFRYTAGSAAERELARVVADRERAYAAIAAVLGVSAPGRITVTLYPDAAATPTGRDVGHTTPDGSAIEVVYPSYEPSYERVSYGHELTHALSARLTGRLHTLPLLSEGLAETLDQSGRDLHVVFSWRTRLLGGRPEPRVEGADLSQKGFYAQDGYAKAGSFVSFLADEYGWAKFLAFYRATADLGAAFPDARWAAFTAAFEKAFGARLSDAEARWDALLRQTAAAPLPRLGAEDEAAVRALFAAQDAAAAEHDLRGVSAGYRRAADSPRAAADARYYAERLLGTDGLELYDLGLKNGRQALARATRRFSDGRAFRVQYRLERREDGWKIDGEEWLR